MLLREVSGFFKFPDYHFRRLDQRLNVPVRGQCDERRSPKVQPSTRPGIEPGTSWLAVIDITNCPNLAHTKKLQVNTEVEPRVAIVIRTQQVGGTLIRKTIYRPKYTKSLKISPQPSSPPPRLLKSYFIQYLF